MPRRITTEALAARLKARGRGRRRPTWYLDLRHEDFGNRGRMTVRDPGHPEWPNGGRAARTRQEALEWLEPAYVQWLKRETRRAGTGSRPSPTVAEACESLLKELARDLGPDHNTVSNWRSAFNVHVKPAFGPLPITALTSDRIRPFLTNLQVTKRRHGTIWKQDAAHHTKTNVRAALQALWHHFDSDAPPPFGEIRLSDRRRRSRARWDAAERGEQVGTRTGYGSDEVRRILAHAVAYDREIIARPNVAARVLPNTAQTIALQLGLATRIDELTFVRWRHVFEEHGLVYVPGTKNESAARWVPIQENLVPWLERLRQLCAGAEPDDFILRVDPRTVGQWQRPSKKTYQGRISKVLERAGLKFEGKATHIFRATHMTWAAATGYSDERLKRWVGHAEPVEGVMNLYIDAEIVARTLIPADRTYLRDLPRPDEVESLAERILDAGTS